MAVINFIQTLSSPFLDFLFQFVTMLGETYFMIFIVAFFLWCYDKKAGYRLALAYLSSGLVNTALKELFRIPRPVGREGIRSLRLETAGGYAFPSGHSQVSATLFTSLLLEVRKRWFSFLAVILMVLVALSRLYLGVHWPADVTAGLLLGAGWVFLSNRVFNYIEDTSKAGILIFLLPGLLGMYFFQTKTYYEAAGALCGLFLGYLIDTNYLRFNVRASFGGQILKFVIGLSGLLLIKVGIKMFLPAALWSIFFSNLLLAIWLTVLAPLVFTCIIRPEN